jgi:hypothetical protein
MVFNTHILPLVYNYSSYLKIRSAYLVRNFYVCYLHSNLSHGKFPSLSEFFDTYHTTFNFTIRLLSPAAHVNTCLYQKQLGVQNTNTTGIHRWLDIARSTHRGRNWKLVCDCDDIAAHAHRSWKLSFSGFLTLYPYLRTISEFIALLDQPLA